MASSLSEKTIAETEILYYIGSRASKIRGVHEENSDPFHAGADI
jgi:hypothetical protein